MAKIRYFILLYPMFFLNLPLMYGQQPDPDFMQSIGKMYVVVAVIIAIFVGLFIFLFFLDRKLTKLENQINHHE